MKILMISKNGDGFGLAQKLWEEGHEVRIWVQSEGFDFVLQNMVEQVSSWRPSASNWADLVISDMVGFGRLATALEQFGVLHLGFNPIADMMELDRAKQMELFRRFQIDIPITEEFENPNAAKAILDDWAESGYVIKPSGNLNTGQTFVVRDADIFDWALDQFAGDQDLIVQRLISGVEISTEGWFNGSSWIEPFNHTFESKRFLNGDVGPNTGCMGNVVWAIDKPEKDRFVQILKRLTPFLKAADYRGPIDLNTMANADGVFALELTPRFGYDAIEALYTLFEQNQLGEMLSELANGTLSELPVARAEFGIAVRLSVPPYPHRKADKRDRGMPIKFPDSPANFFLTDVYLNNDMFLWAASDGVLAKVTARAKSIKEARARVYKLVRSVRAQGLQYRTDIGLDLDKKISQLENWGYLPGKSILKKVIG